MYRFIKRGNSLLSNRQWLFRRIRCASTAVDHASSYTPGQKLHGYSVNEVTSIPELFLTAVSLTHDKTSAKHLHIARDDGDNAFGVAFKTTPLDSTGVPHILEHTALCGSARFPVRDPFFKMLNRSQATFMNAFTANDWTMYPFSTQNRQDFANLLSIYLDAAFFPQLREQDFRQEGWRLEHEVTSDRDSAIIFKGIVFNEMKGVFSNSQQLFAQRLQNLLLPSHTYGVCAGGDPNDIPSLTWEQLRHFHRLHYHPTNSRFYTYGDTPLETHLQQIDADALAGFDVIDPGTDVPLEPRWDKPREAEMTCAPNPMVSDATKQTTFAVSYLLADVTETFESFVLSFIGSLLTHGETAPFYKILIEPNIGSDFAPTLGYDGQTRDASFSIGLEGIHRDDATNVKKLIDETFDKVIEDGFDAKRIEMLIHKIELSQRHVYNNFGLYLGVNLVSAWSHGASVMELLQTNQAIARLQMCIRENPRFLQDKVKQYFKDNPHRVSLTMSPDNRYEDLRQTSEKAQLDAIVKSLSDEDKDTIFEKGLSLAKQQNTEEDLSCLPALKISDIVRTVPEVSVINVQAGGVNLQTCEQPTNGVTYFRSISNMRDLRDDLKPLVPLFCNVVTKMGAGGLNYGELSQEIDLRSGGFGANVHITDHHTLDNVYEEGVLFSSYSLDRNVEAMFGLWQRIFESVNLSDTDRLRTLVVMSAAELAQGLSDAGHAIAMSNSASGLSPSAALKESLAGITQVNFMKSLAEIEDLTPVLQQLADIAAHLLNKQNMRLAVNATAESMPHAVKELERFVGAIAGDVKDGTLETNTVMAQFTPSQSQTHYVLPFQVYYAGRSVKTTPYTHHDYASLRVLARLMTNKYLHREIREKGGAYGGGASGATGTLSFYSYRDPNSMKTLESFDGAVDWAMAGNFSQQDIDEAKLAIFQKIDAPVPPGDRGMQQFLAGVGNATRASHREQLFAVDRDALVCSAERYLSTANRTTAATLLGPQNTVTRDSSDWVIKQQ